MESEIEQQYKAYKERMVVKGFQFLTVGFEEFAEAINQAKKQEEKNNGRINTKNSE